MYPVFDTHTHTYPEAVAQKAVQNLGAFYQFPVAGRGTYDDLAADAAVCPLRGFLLFSVATNAHQVTKVNDGIAALVGHARQAGFEAVGFAGMHQDFPDVAGEVRRAKSLGLGGVKLHPDIQGVNIDDVRLMRLYEILEQEGMTVYFHIGDNRPQYRFSEARRLLTVREHFPELKMVAAHLGGYLAWNEAEAYLRGMPKLWFDSSSSLDVLPPAEAVRLIRSLGTDRVMFGSDYPRVRPSDELSRFLTLDLTEEERRGILYGNAARLFGLKGASE